MAFPRAILLISCPDRPGIIARVSNLLYSLECNIIDSDQHTDDEDGHFFWRILFESQSRTIATVITEIGAALPKLFTEIELHYELFDAAYRERMVIMVSRLHHCMMDLLSRHHSGELDAEVAAVISNHPDLDGSVEKAKQVQNRKAGDPNPWVTDLSTYIRFAMVNYEMMQAMKILVQEKQGGM